MLCLRFSTLKRVSKVETILLQAYPQISVSITKQLRPVGLTPSHKAITRTLWKPLPVSNLSLTSHLFFLLAPRQHWDQTQAPLSCNRDKMAFVVLGFCDCRWISFLGSPNLLLGPVLSANPAGFIRPVHSIQLYLAGLFFLVPQWIAHQSWWPKSEHWSNTAKPPHSAVVKEVGEIYCIGFRNWLWFVRMEVGVSLIGPRETCRRLWRWIIVWSMIRQGRFICK